MHSTLLIPCLARYIDLHFFWSLSTNFCFPDGTTVLSNSRDHTLKAFDLRKEYQVVHTYKHDDYCNGSDWARSCYSSDNRYVVAGGNDGAVFIWDAKTAALEKKLVKGHSTAVLCVCWNPNGTQLVSSDKGGNVQIWTAA